MIRLVFTKNAAVDAVWHTMLAAAVALLFG